MEESGGVTYCGGFCLAELLLALGLLTSACWRRAVAGGDGGTGFPGPLAGDRGHCRPYHDESLTDLWERAPSDAALAPGSHGPRTVEVRDPWNGTVLNRYRVTWEVESVGDPRPGKSVRARTVTVHVAPVEVGGEDNIRPMFNQSLDLATVLGQGTS